MATGWRSGINRSHQSDIGGATHGAYNPGATEIWQEGIRIPPLRLYEAGRLRQDVLDLIVLNVRHPREFRGDLAAMIGSARVGERRLAALLDEFGPATAHAAIEAVLDGAERQVRAVIAAWPDGVYHGEAVLDDDGHGAKDVYPRQGDQRGSDLEVDLSDPHPQVTGFINSSYPNMRSAVVVALAYLIDPETPKNDGAFRCERDRQGGHGGGRGRARRSRCAPITAARRSSRRSSRRWRRPVRTAPWPAGEALPDRASGQGPAHRQELHLAHVPGAAGRRRLARRRWLARRGRVAGGGRHQVRQPRGGRVRFPLFFRRHEFRRTPAATAATAAAPRPSSRWSWKWPSRRSPTRRATACATAPAASSAAKTACPSLRAEIGGPAGPHRSRPRRSASRSGQATCSTSAPPAAAGSAIPGRSAEERARDRLLGFVTAGGSAREARRRTAIPPER